LLQVTHPHKQKVVRDFETGLIQSTVRREAAHEFFLDRVDVFADRLIKVPLDELKIQVGEGEVSF
jgi:hypothetical protein